LLDTMTPFNANSRKEGFKEIPVHCGVVCSFLALVIPFGLNQPGPESIEGFLGHYWRTVQSRVGHRVALCVGEVSGCLPPCAITVMF